ncbi:MAG: hypothetical protein GAK37_00494 [Pseudomonas sp.]|nr:MAG: hypothetical protein GAK37_00494 [Pseudomonas sp.]
MNTGVRSLAVLLMGLTVGFAAHAQNLPGDNNPYNSPIHRANPNSMQGTQPSAPAPRGPQIGPTPRQPTLENGGIGNGYPQRNSAPAPNSIQQKTPTYDANGNRRP